MCAQALNWSECKRYMFVLHLLLSNVAAVQKIVSYLCVLEMLGADLYDIWPEVHLDDHEAEPASHHGGAF